VKFVVCDTNDMQRPWRTDQGPCFRSLVEELLG
jgi:hypothetical protein